MQSENYNLPTQQQKLQSNNYRQQITVTQFSVTFETDRLRELSD